MTHTPISGAELQLHTSDPAPSAIHSPLVSVLATIPPHLLRITPDASSTLWWFAMRGPFTVVGLLLGAAVWYIARRLYGNAGGYIALTLYCFSPAIVAHSSVVAADIVAAFGAFGLIWTSVAVAHTLYAPREVVLWNWKRIVLLGIAIAIGVGAQFAVGLLLLLGLAFIVYLVPHRRGAALAILGSACGVGLVLLFAIYGFRPLEFASGLRHALWAELSTVAVRRPTSWKMVGLFFVDNSAGLALLVAMALLTFAAWKRTRYFGTSAPLLTCVALLACVMLMPRAAGFSFLIVMLPFAIVFVSGVCADLLENKNIAVRSLATGIIIAVLITHALFSVVALSHLPRRGERQPPSNSQVPQACIHDKSCYALLRSANCSRELRSPAAFPFWKHPSNTNSTLHSFREL
jgi:hypothetical protein